MEFIRPMGVQALGSTVHCPVLSLLDRRTARPRQKEWLLSKSVETILFGPSNVRVH